MCFSVTLLPVPLRPNFEMDCDALLATGADVSQHLIDAQLVDDPHTLGRYTQFHKALFVLNPETVMVQVGFKTALGFVVRVRYVVADDRTLAGNLTNLSHCLFSKSVAPLTGTTLQYSETLPERGCFIPNAFGESNRDAVIRWRFAANPGSGGHFSGCSVR